MNQFAAAAIVNSLIVCFVALVSTLGFVYGAGASGLWSMVALFFLMRARAGREPGEVGECARMDN